MVIAIALRDALLLNTTKITIVKQPVVIALECCTEPAGSPMIIF